MWIIQFCPSITLKSCRKENLPFNVYNLCYSRPFNKKYFVFLRTFHFFEVPQRAALALLANPLGHSG